MILESSAKSASSFKKKLKTYLFAKLTHPSFSGLVSVFLRGVLI